MVTVIVPTFNRPRMFNNVIRSLNIPASLTESVQVLVAADATNYRLDLSSLKCQWHVIRNSKRCGCDLNIVRAIDTAIQMGSEWIVNVEDDAYLSPLWFPVWWYIRSYKIAGAYSVYNSNKHPSYHIIPTPFRFSLCYKRTVGGLGVGFSKEVANRLLKYISVNGMGRGWDWQLCEVLKDENVPFIVTTPSYIQHIRTMGQHTDYRVNKDYDQALDFIGDM